jgi:hypothetical protein
MCKRPDSSIATAAVHYSVGHTDTSSGQAESFSHPVTAYNPELCKHQKFKDTNQYSGEIWCGLELFIIKEKMCSRPDTSVDLLTVMGSSHSQAVSVRV